MNCLTIKSTLLCDCIVGNLTDNNQCWEEASDEKESLLPLKMCAFKPRKLIVIFYLSWVLARSEFKSREYKTGGHDGKNCIFLTHVFIDSKFFGTGWGIFNSDWKQPGCCYTITLNFNTDKYLMALSDKYIFPKSLKYFELHFLRQITFLDQEITTE